MDIPSSWDELRKQARKIEAQLDEQMHSYRRLVSTKSDGAASDLEAGIDLLLRQLQQVNAQMQAWVSSGGSEMVSHTLTRHQEILQDLTHEFYRHRSSLEAKQERASLLEDFKEFDRARLDLEAGDGSSEQALLKEHVGINSNTAQMDDVISQAQATLGTLVFQRSTFGGINSKLSNVTSRLPTDGDKEFKDQSREEDDALVIPPGPITRAKARRLKEAVGSLLMISWKQEDGLDGRLINQDTLITIQAMVSN